MISKFSWKNWRFAAPRKVLVLRIFEVVQNDCRIEILPHAKRAFSINSAYSYAFLEHMLKYYLGS